MSAENGIFNGNGSGIEPYHFIYLDRQRLTSYVAQTSDGVTLLRRLLDSNTQRNINVPAEKYRQEVREESAVGEVNVGPDFLGFGGTKEKKTSRTKSIKESDPTQEYGSFQALLEDKLDHDNLYLLLEQDLNRAGRLRNVDAEWLRNPRPGLVKATGTSRFVDWQAIGKFLEQIDSMWSNLAPQVRQSFGNQKSSPKFISHLLKTMSLGPLTLHMQITEVNLISSLNPVHLAMTFDQLRVAYVMPGDLEVTLVGFSPGKPSKQTTLPGLPGAMNMGDYWQAFVGTTDVVVDPIAIYGTIT